MKTSKFFLSTLIAAAAMSANAYADTNIETAQTISSDTVYEGSLCLKNSGSVTQTAGTVTAERLLIHTANNNQSETYSLTGGVLEVTGGDSSVTGTNVGEAQSAVIIGHWGNNGGLSTLSIGSGAVLNVTSGWTMLSWDTSSLLNIEGEANLHGISFSGGANYTPTATLTLKSGGRLNLGSGGFVNETRTRGAVNINLEGGTLGALDSWSASVAMNVSGDVVIDTTKRVSNSTAASTEGTEGVTITLAGNINVSETGSLTVEGSGVLELSGAVNLSTSIKNSGTVSIAKTAVFALAGLSGVEDNSGTTYTLVSGTGTTTFADGMNIANLNFAGTNFVERGTSVTFFDGKVTVTGGAAGTLTWAGTDGNNTWNSTATNWMLSSDSSATSFMYRDNVKFDNTTTTQTVFLTGGTYLTVGTAEVDSGDYTWAVSDNNKATISGNTLTIANGASLTVGNQGNNTAKQVSLDFDSISVAGTLNFNTSQANTWSSLTLEEGGKLHFIDGTAGAVNLSVANLVINGSANITAQWDKKLVVDVLSGAGDLTITGMTTTDSWSGRMTIALNDLSDYTGAMTLNNGSGNGLTVTASDSSKLAGKTIAIGEGVQFNVTSTADPDTTTDLSGITGMGTLSFDLKNDNGAGFNLSGFTGTVEVGSGRFQMNTSTFNDAAKIKIISGGDLVFNATEETDVSNAVTFAADSTIHVNTGKRGMLSGTIDAQDRTITKAGSGVLTLVGEATIGTLSQTTGTLTLAGEATIGTLGQTGGTLEVSGNVSATRYVGTQNGGTAGTFSIADTGVLTITGDVDDVTGNASSFLLSNWGAKTTMNVAGVLNLQNVGLNNRDGTAEISVNDGGEFNFGKGLTINENGGNSGAVILNLNEGGRLNIGASGINSANYLTLNLRSGTIGSLADSWSSDRSMGLGGTIVVDTTKMSMNTSGKATSSGTGSAITLSGVLSGTGAIVKDGAGTLTLSGDNTYTGGTTISQGTLVAAQANALGTGPVDILSGATLQADTQITLSSDLTLNVSENDLVSLSRESNTPLITGKGVELAQNASLYVNRGALGLEETLALQLAAGSALLVEESQIKIGAWVGSEWLEIEHYTEVSWNSETGVLTLAIPEPSLFGLLAGLGALTLVGTRRRRSKKS